MISTAKIKISEITLVVSLFLFMNTASAQGKSPVALGLWAGNLQLTGNAILPFNFEIKKDADIYSLTFFNGEERIVANEVLVKADSIIIRMPFFDSEFKCEMKDGKAMTGNWINHNRKEKNIIPFNALFIGDSRNAADAEISFSSATPIVDGRWECSFSPYTLDSSRAVGVFRQVNRSSKITGTFLTETGDHRYLEGKESPDGKKLFLGCFDGAHAFLFIANIKGDSLVDGDFYSGIHAYEPWVAVRNEKFELRNPYDLTFLKKGFDKVNFSYKNLEGKTVSLSDAKYRNKVVIVQLMGSWCPNCMDETKFLAGFYDSYHPKGLEIIGLAFERTDDFNKAVSNVNRLKTKFGAHYDFLVTMKTGAQQASEVFPMLNKVMAFPTTIYIDKKGTVRKIYTGFYGPATGDYFLKYKEETTRFVEGLLKE